MLSFFRSLAKSKLLWILLGFPMVAGLMTIGNVRADLGDLFTPKDAVIHAGQRVYTTDDFKREFDAYRKQQAGQDGAQMSPDDAVSQGIDQRMLSAFAERESLGEILHKLGIHPSDKLIFDKQIAQIPAFRDPVTGKFDSKTYVSVLSQNGLTPAAFEKSERDELTYSQFASGLAAGLKPPRIYGGLVGAYELEQHNLTLFSIDPKILGAEPQPTDDDLKKLMQQHAAQLTVPETRTLTVVKFSAADIAKTLTPDPVQVKKVFDFKKDTLSTAEKRTLIQISAKDAAQAQDVAAKLKAGGDPAAVAKAAGLQTPLIYNDTPKTGIADSKVADAAFALPAGGVSNPVQGNLGWAVVKIGAITPGKTVSFEEARPQIEEQVKTEQAQKKAYDMVQKYEDAHEKGSTMAEAAVKAGVTPQTFEPVTSGGQNVEAAPVMGLSPRLLKEAFVLTQGSETDAVNDSKGEYFAVRVEKIIPPAPPPFDKVRPRLLQAYLQQEMSKRLTTKLDELIARIKKGETLEAVAQSVGATPSKVSVTRQQAQSAKNLPPGLVNQIFAAKVGDVFPTGGGVARADSIVLPTPGVIAATMSAAQLSLARGMFDEIQEETRAWSRDQIKPKVNITLARSAIGATVSASSAAPARGVPAGPPKPAN